jgi:hypothetical protein
LASAAVCLLAVSCRTASPAPPSASPEVAREQLLDIFESKTPVFCAESYYFRSCFTISAEECLATMAESVRSCVAQYESELPAQVPESVAMPWAAKVGKCAGTAFEIVQVRAKISSEACSDYRNWMTPPPIEPAER